MTDKERILTAIMAYTSHPTFKTDEYQTKWVYVDENTKLVPGDVVMSCTQRFHRHAISFVVEAHSENHLLVREIGTNNTCNYSNEMFKVLRNFPSDLLLEGDQCGFKTKIFKALKNEGMLYYQNVKFTSDGIFISIRLKWTQDIRTFEFPLTVPLKRVSIKSIKSCILSNCKDWIK
jgi:hypothetical protein